MAAVNNGYPPAGISTLTMQTVSSRFKLGHRSSVVTLPLGSLDVSCNRTMTSTGKQFLISILIAICSFNTVEAAESIKYVWSIKGVNVRSSPSTNSKKLTAIPYGDSVKVLQVSSSTTTITYIDSLYKGIKSIQIKGQWLKIKYGHITGFVFGPFLLDVPCAKQGESFNEYASRMSEIYKLAALKTEYTVQHDGNPGLMVFDCQLTRFPGGKEISFFSTQTINRDSLDITVELIDHYESFSESFYLKGFTFQEFIIILNYFYMNDPERKYGVFENNPDNIRLTDSRTQTLDIWLYRDGAIIFSFEDAGC